MAHVSTRTRMIGRALVFTLAATGLGVFASPQPAVAQTTYSSAPRLSWTYTDSRDAHSSFTAGQRNVPVGAWRDPDGKLHLSRSYATFDLEPYAGKTIVEANLFFRDDKTTDCSVRSLAVTETAVPDSAPTWSEPPAATAALGTVGANPCPGVARVVLTERIRAAVAAGQTRIAVEIRVPDSEPGEGDVALGRSLSWYYGVRLTIGYNTPPRVVEEHLYNDYRPCVTDAPYPHLGGTEVNLGAMLVEPDENRSFLSGEFAVWPVDNPDQRTIITKTLANSGFVNYVTIPAGIITDGGSYGWSARANDGTDASPWSRSCYFTYDSTRPSAAPGVTSPNYPEGVQSPGGRAPVFTFTPNGVDDVAAYQYSFDVLGVPGVPIGPYGVPRWTDPFDGSQFVRADSIGGSATVTIPITSWSWLRLSVRSFDRAYNSGPVREYAFIVNPTDPSIIVSDPPTAAREPFEMTFAKHPDVVEVIDYTYRINGGDERTVAAGADGAATVTVSLPAYGHNDIRVRSRSSNGWISSEAGWFHYLDNTPAVTSEVYPEDGTGGGVGVTGTFTLRPGPAGADSYVYSFNWGEEVTVAAGADGTATISFTPELWGYHQLDVRAVDINGVESEAYTYVFDVADLTLPIVTSETYPEWSVGGGAGVEGTFTFRSASDDTAAFRYAFNYGPEATVPVGPDGSATISFTPEYGGFNELYVYSVDENGERLGGSYDYYFFVAE